MAAADYVAAVLADGPVAYYQCQENSGLLLDSSGNGRHTTGTRTGTGASVLYGQQGPRLGQSITSQAETFTVAPVMTVVDNLTMEAWVSGSPVSGGGPIPFMAVGRDPNAGFGGAGDGYSLGLWNAASILPGVQVWQPTVATTQGNIQVGAGDPNRIVTSPAGVSWSHVVAVRRAGQWETWVGGVRCTLVSTDNKTPATPTTETFLFNANFSTAWVGTTFRLCHAAFYDKALTGARIQAHYAAMYRWPDLTPIQDNAPAAAEAGSFTTQGGNGIIPAPTNDAEYPYLSGLGIGGGDVELADGVGVSVFP